MKVLLTGASGFLGGHIKSFLAQEQVVLSTLGRTMQCSIVCDLASEIPELTSNFDLVIHAAGKAHSVPKTEEEKKEFFNVNYIGTLNLIKGLEESQSLPLSFVYISSVSVYGKESGFNITEDAPLMALEAYGLSKIQSEEIIKDWCASNNIICTILRVPLMVGLNPPGNLGLMLEGIRKGYYFNIGGGRVQKSMVLVSDVAECLLKVSKIGGVYNLTDGSHPTFYELSHAIALQYGRKYVPNISIHVAMVFSKIGDLLGESFVINSRKLSKIVSPLTFDDSKARKEFGWQPREVLKSLKVQ